MTDPLCEWIHEEQAALWTDFKNAIDYSNNGYWSMQAADIARRIVSAARLVGPVSWREVPTTLMYAGLLEALYRVGGIEYTAPAPEEIAATTALIIRTGGSLPKTEELERYARTIEAMRTPREAAHIRNTDTEDGEPS
jgi:hypothetical protein